MSNASAKVDRHYGRGGIFDSILASLDTAGKDRSKLAASDLAPVDEFHLRGRAATIELANLAAPAPGSRVLDVGCGLGGSARYLAAERSCRVTGIDLTAEYIDVARALAALVGLDTLTEYRQASALELPFAGESFDLAWTEHVQMNVSNKSALYAEIARVLVPGGLLALHDIFQGSGGALHYPVPWADDASISHLVTPSDARDTIEAAGFEIVHWEDKTRPSFDWLQGALGKLKACGPPPLGLHLLMGDTARLKLENNLRNIAERRFVVMQAVARKC